MRSRLMTVGSLAVLGVVAATSIAVAASNTSDITNAQTLVLRGTSTSFHFINLGSRKPGPGDQFVLTERLSANGKAMGQLNAHCTLVSRDFLCEVASVLPKGEIVSTGMVPANGGRPGTTFTLAVTGGTGAYQNVRGQHTIRQLTRNTDRQTLQLLP